MDDFLSSNFGELIALLTAVCWTFTSMAFEYAGKRVGSLSVNFLRLVIAMVFLSMLMRINSNSFLPVGFSSESWLWLLLSGLIGFVIGDLMLFQAFVVVGARISMLMMSLAPIFAGIFGWMILGERITLFNFFSIVITLTGIALVIFNRPARSGITVNYPLGGVLLALGGAAGQGLGLVLSKLGMGDHNAFMATQIRVMAGIGGFTIMFFISGYWPKVFKALKNRKAMRGIAIGAFFGPFLGVSLSLLSIKYISTAIASTIMAIVPVLIIPPAIIFFRERVTLKEILGAIVAVAGVIMFFMD